MEKLQLVGYTADLEYLVFCDAAEGASRFKASVDEDLLATLAEVVERTDPERLTAFLPQPPPPPPPPPRPAPPRPAPAQRSGPKPGVGPLAAVALLVGTADERDPPAITDGDGPLDAPPAVRGSRLSPREIQALLRMGRTPVAVAKQAGVDEAWVQRWLPPIEAERARIIAAARGARVTKARKGPSANPLGEAVDRSLAAKNADEGVEWSATRRDGDPYWVVAVRYHSRGKARRARWRFDPDTREVEPEDTTAGDLAWTSRPGTPRTVARKPSTQAKKGATSTQRLTAKRPAVKATARTSTKKSTGQTTRRRASSKKAPAKQATAKKAPAKEGAAKKVPLSTAPARKSPATSPRRKPASQAPAKKRPAKKASAKDAAVDAASRSQPGTGDAAPPS